MERYEHTTVAVGEETRDRLASLRDAYGYRSYDELLSSEFLDRDDE
jgi:hypothetical protein